MSLHTLANHLQTAGRGEDKVLVHMTPGEVNGLQSLAMAHGGSLTINPETGLPEAGFLSGILPMVAGAALAATGVGAPMAALMVGGAGAVATGSLSKGLMMGLGAYGGAGLGAGLMGGAQAAGASGLGAAGTVAAQNAANLQAANISQIGNTMGAGAASGAGTLMPAAAPAVTMPGVAASAPGVQTMGGMTPYGVTAPPPVVASSVNPATGLPAASAPSLESATSMWDKLKSMPGKAFDLMSGTGPEAEKAREDFLKQNKNYLLAGGLGTLAMSRDEQKQPKESSNYQTFNPTWNRIMQSGGNYQAGAYTGTGERRFFADGGSVGQPVEQMSQENSVGANTNYPMANSKPYGYAVPKNYPVSQNVFQPESYERVDPYTGEQKFAKGGLASLVSMKTGGFVSKLKAVPEPKKATPKLQNIAPLEKSLSGLEKYSGLGDAQDRIKDINSQIKGLNKKDKSYKSDLTRLNKELQTAQADSKNYGAYKSAASKLEAAKAANEKATNSVNQQYEDAMSKYNEYKNKLEDEKKSWEEQTTRQATGLQSIKAQKVTRPAVEEKEGTYTPKYTVDPKTGKTILTSELKPVTEFQKYSKVPGFDPTKKIIEPEDVIAVFQDVAGRKPTQQELDTFVGSQNSQAAIAKYATKLPDVVAKVAYDDTDLKDNFKYYIGRDPSAGELSNMRKQVSAGKIQNFNQLRSYIQTRPQYLENINAVAQAAFTDQQKLESQKVEEQIKAASALTPEQVRTSYKDALSRDPTMDELMQYMGAKQTQEGLTGELKKSDEYLKTLTKPLVAEPQQATAVAPISFEKYAPGTILQQGAPAMKTTDTTGLGDITGYQPTASGLQTPLNRGAVTLEGAMSLNPTFQEQLGIQTLASQAAEKAPALQTGLKFEAPQPANQFGFQPYAAPTQPVAPQSIEALLAALRSQQAQGTTQMASGGIADYNLGGYSDGGRLLKGPGDGVSDSIPASIGDRQPARLADGEFVVPARIVSELGNGSTDAGARKLYAMMDRVQRARRKTVGSGKVAVNSRADKLLPA